MNSGLARNLTCPTRPPGDSTNACASTEFVTLAVGPGSTFPITTVTINTVLDANYYTVLVDSAGGTTTITLPTAASSVRKFYNIKKIDSTTHPVIIVVSGGGTIDFSTGVVLSYQYNSIQVQSNGAAWWEL